MDIWKEGKYIDLWSINHFLSGVVFAGWMLVFGVGFWLTLLLYIVVAVAWELFEIVKGIREYKWNGTVDVILGIMGALLIIQVRHLWGMQTLIIVSVIFVILEVHGYIAYRKRGK